jgi:mRNA-degrading endonuclease RelE of RelBE toxin-antitoxin system
MKADYSARAGKTLRSLPAVVQKALYKQVRYLEQNLQHPSLHAKKYDEPSGLWQARINRDWRFYFFIQDDTFLIVNIVPHPK